MTQRLSPFRRNMLRAHKYKLEALRDRVVETAMAWWRTRAKNGAQVAADEWNAFMLACASLDEETPP